MGLVRMKKVIFMGTPDFAVPVLERILEDGYLVELVVTQPDRPKGRKKTMTPPSVKVAAEKNNIPVFQPEKIKDNFEPIQAIEPDLIVTAAFGQILPKELLDIPRYGCINVHASLLPELRGGAPIHYAILNGHQKTGITIMYMAEKLDAGDIISQSEVKITEQDDVGSLHDKLSVIGADLLSDTIPKIFNEQIEPIKQEEALATFAPNITREQEKIKWENSMQQIFDQIRGLHPWPVASTKWRGNNLKIYHATKSEKQTNQHPGEIVDITEDGIVVATGDSKGIIIKTLQPAGKKKMSAADFIRGVGNNLEVGEKLGE